MRKNYNFIIFTSPQPDLLQTFDFSNYELPKKIGKIINIKGLEYQVKKL